MKGMKIYIEHPQKVCTVQVMFNIYIYPVMVLLRSLLTNFQITCQLIGAKENTAYELNHDLRKIWDIRDENAILCNSN